MEVPRPRMVIRVATLNLEQNHKCWDERRELIAAQMLEVRPDLWALNEIHIPSQTGRWLQQQARMRWGSNYSLAQQSKTGEESQTQGEGLLTRFPLLETANLNYQSYNCVALVGRFEIDTRLIDVYVTHLIATRAPDEARQEQATRLLEWVDTRADADCSIVCGDFNAAPAEASTRLMSMRYRPTQTQPTAFTPLREANGQPTHPEWPRFDRCIDYIWVSRGITVRASGLCFNQPAQDNPDLWPSDHVGVWADLELG
jgi:endonuclease/exonuclease/phosphatase family metal-dependent hydrolase